MLEQIFALAVQPNDGKLVAAGVSFASGNGNFVVLRFNSDGSLDNTFAFVPGVSFGFKFEEFGGSEGANALVVQPDGKIVVAGLSNASGNGDFVLVRKIKASSTHGIITVRILGSFNGEFELRDRLIFLTA